MMATASRKSKLKTSDDGFPIALDNNPDFDNYLQELETRGKDQIKNGQFMDVDTLKQKVRAIELEKK